MIFNDRPAVIGHRGMGSGIINGLAENTMASFLAAAEAGAGWIELDVHRTSDDQLVVSHDPIGRHRLGVVAERAADTDLPLLTDVLAALPIGLGVNLDVKTVLADAVDPAHRHTGALVTPIAATEVSRRPILVSSFDPGVILASRVIAPAVPRCLLSSESLPIWHAVPAALSVGANVIALYAASFWPNIFAPGPAYPRPGEVVDIVHRAGLEIMAWCPRNREITDLVRAGVDALCVDDVPAAVLAVHAAMADA